MFDCWDPQSRKRKIHKHHSRGEINQILCYSAGNKLQWIFFVRVRTNTNIKACLLRATTTPGIVWAVCICVCMCVHVCVGVCPGECGGKWIKQICAWLAKGVVKRRVKLTAGNTYTHTHTQNETHSLNTVCRFNLTASRQTKSLISSHLSLSEVSGDELKGGWCALAAISVTNAPSLHTHVHTHAHARTHAC